MQPLVLSDEQVKIIVSAESRVQVRDGNGNVLGVFSPIWTSEDIAEAKRRLASDEPRYTTAEVLDYLRSKGKE